MIGLMTKDPLISGGASAAQCYPDFIPSILLMKPDPIGDNTAIIESWFNYPDFKELVTAKWGFHRYAKIELNVYKYFVAVFNKIVEGTLKNYVMIYEAYTDY